MTILDFSIQLTVADKDVNAREHVSYDKYFVFFQEARIAFLAALGYCFDGAPRMGLIATEAHCTYKKELRLGDAITVGCGLRELKKKSFVMDFVICRDDRVCAEGSATFLCFDYENRAVIAFPRPFMEAARLCGPASASTSDDRFS